MAIILAARVICTILKAKNANPIMSVSFNRKHMRTLVDN